MTIRKSSLTFHLIIACWLFVSSKLVVAGPIDIFQLSAFLTSTEIAPIAQANFSVNSLQDDRIGGGGFNEFGIANVNVGFTNNLNANNNGEVIWTLTNGRSSSLTNLRFFVFLDADIDEANNGGFNESGTLIEVNPDGAGNNADFWEIDEPGFPISLGNIVNNLLDGMLDNSNTVMGGNEGDVSLALGFEIGTLSAGESFMATIEISEQNIGGLSQTDSGGPNGTNNTFFFNGSTSKTSTVPAPAALPLLVFSFVAVMWHRGFRN